VGLLHAVINCAFVLFAA